MAGAKVVVSPIVLAVGASLAPIPFGKPSPGSSSLRPRW